MMTLLLSQVVLLKHRVPYFAMASLSNVATNRNYSICFLLFKEVRASDTVTFMDSFVEAIVLCFGFLVQCSNK